MSSRNAYLSPEERAQAVVLSRALGTAERLVAGGERDAASLEKTMREVISSAPLAEIDYVSIVDADDLRAVSRVAGDCLAAVAVRFGGTRLIDNTSLRV